MKNWDFFTASNLDTGDSTKQACPISFSEEDMAECLRLENEQINADAHLKAAKDTIGVGYEGWIPSEQYDGVKERDRILKAHALAAAESEEERTLMDEHWLFEDFGEDEYL